jgi:hypothetical protein
MKQNPGERGDEQLACFADGAHGQQRVLFRKADRVPEHRRIAEDHVDADELLKH